MIAVYFFFFQAEDGIRDVAVTGVQTCALPIYAHGTIPKRSTSNRDANVAIISIAQHASPNVTGQIDDFRAQLKTFSVVVVTIQPPGMWWIVSAIAARVLDVLSSVPRS